MLKKILLICILCLTFAISNVEARPESVVDPSIDGNTPRKVSCGNITGIPRKFPELTNYAITVVQVAVPVILVIVGTMDMIKGIVSQKEDEIKKGQKVFLKRLILALMIFAVIVFTKLLVSIVAEGSTQNIVECIDCFLNGIENCSDSVKSFMEN